MDHIGNGKAIQSGTAVSHLTMPTRPKRFTEGEGTYPTPPVENVISNTLEADLVWNCCSIVFSFLHWNISVNAEIVDVSRLQCGAKNFDSRLPKRNDHTGTYQFSRPQAKKGLRTVISYHLLYKCLFEIVVSPHPAIRRCESTRIFNLLHPCIEQD